MGPVRAGRDDRGRRHVLHPEWLSVPKRSRSGQLKQVEDFLVFESTAAVEPCLCRLYTAGIKPHEAMLLTGGTCEGEDTAPEAKKAKL